MRPKQQTVMNETLRCFHRSACCHARSGARLPRIAGTIVQIILAEQIPLRSNRITRKVAGVKNLRTYLPQEAHPRDLALTL
jgi:hypothetical protein